MPACSMLVNLRALYGPLSVESYVCGKTNVAYIFSTKYVNAAIEMKGKDMRGMLK